MNEVQAAAEVICRELSAGSAVVFARIIAHEGSAPRHRGARMVVGGVGLIAGTVGGGLIEAASIKASSLALAKGQSRVIQFDMDGRDATAPGMICGGEATLLIDVITPSTENLEFFAIFKAAMEAGRAFFYVNMFDRERGEVAGRSILFDDGSVVGTYLWSGEDLDHVKASLEDVSTIAVKELENLDVIVERIGKTPRLFCFGGGHVAVPTVKVASLVGFEVTVVDDRPDFANRQRFPEAGEVMVREDVSNCLGGLPIDSDSFIVIVTRGHKYDREVLEQALRTKARYIGMIGSLRKRDAIYEAVLRKGFTQADLARVHSPIGLPIGAETPEEIAVSIVGELVSERNKES